MAGLQVSEAVNALRRSVDDTENLLRRGSLAQMNHKIFSDRLKTALKAKSDGRYDESAAELRALLNDLAPAVKSGVNDWHHQQVVALLVDTLDVAGREDECRAAWKDLVELTDGNALYWQNALSSAREDFARWRLQHPG